MSHPQLLFCVHAVQRMFERGISTSNVRQVVESGKTIEDYTAEMPEPGRLVLGFQGRRPIHVVISENLKTNERTIITAYLPDSGKWNKDFTRRKS